MPLGGLEDSMPPTKNGSTPQDPASSGDMTPRITLAGQDEPINCWETGGPNSLGFPDSARALKSSSRPSCEQEKPSYTGSITQVTASTGPGRVGRLTGNP